MRDLLLIDLSSIYHPIWHAMPPDEPASAPHDATVRRVRAMAERVDHVAVCCDAPTNWRKAEYPEYKAQRAARPAEMFIQLERAIDTLKRDGFHVLKVDGYEADDLVATLVEQASREQDVSVTIATADKDLAQLLRYSGVCIQPTRLDAEGKVPAVVTRSEIEAKFGVKVEQLGDWLALCGDASDNIPGVPKIGAKTATALLVAYGSLDLVLAAARHDDPEMKPALKRQLVDFEAQARLSRRLVELRIDAAVTLADAMKPRVTKSLVNRTVTEEVPEPEEWNHMNVENEETANTQPAPAPEPARLALVEAQPEPEPPPARVPQVQRPKPEETTAMVRVEPGTDAWALALEPQGMRQANWLAEQLFNSRFFGFSNPEATLSALMLVRSLGLPAMAIRNVHVIKGKLALHASMIVGLCLKSGLCEYFDVIETTHQKAVFETKRKGRPPVRLEYTIDDARMAGLAKQDGAWTKTPRTMLRHRCATELARMVFPDICSGTYSPEELVDEAEDLPRDYRGAA